MTRKNVARKLSRMLTKEVSGMKLKKIPSPKYELGKPHSILELSCYSVRPSALKRRKTLKMSCLYDAFINSNEKIPI